MHLYLFKYTDMQGTTYWLAADLLFNFAIFVTPQDIVQMFYFKTLVRFLLKHS